MIKLFKHHPVKWIALATTAFVFVRELVLFDNWQNNLPLSFLIILIGVQLRGIFWENTYANDLLKAQEELEIWRNK